MEGVTTAMGSVITSLMAFGVIPYYSGSTTLFDVWVWVVGGWVKMCGVGFPFFSEYGSCVPVTKGRVVSYDLIKIQCPQYRI